jgi:hypothetical protein
MALLHEAEEKLRPPSGLMAFFSSGTIRTEEAAELFTKAANYFKLAKRCMSNAPASHATIATSRLVCSPNTLG